MVLDNRQKAVLHNTEGYNVSNKYNVINTMDVVQQFQRYGFEINSVQAAGTRDISKLGKQKHLVRMRAEQRLAPGLAPEVIIVNSYDGTKALDIRIGVFRFVCSNGLISGTNLFPGFRIMHSNIHWEDELNEFIDQYDEKYHQQKEWIEHMQERKMTLDESYYLAERALNDRHYDKRIELNVVDPLELLVAKRKGDRGDNAWLRYNIIQENIINGYFHKYDAEGSIRKAKIITNVDEIVRLNVTLSDIFDEVLEEA